MQGAHQTDMSPGPDRKHQAPFSLLIKPAGPDCNLRCGYCFYSDKKKLYPASSTHRMSDDTLHTLFKRYMETPQPVYSMIWQGGEPTLMGASFYRRVTDLQKQLAPRGSRIANSLQTNAVCVSEKLAAHLGKYRFLAGCSLDGPPDLHDACRKTASGRPTHHLVTRGIRTLAAHNVPVNALILVSAANVDAPLRVYRHLLDLGLTHLQFIPCVEYDRQGRALPFSINGPQWGRFLLAVFDEWFDRCHWNVSIRNFDSILAKMVNGHAGECRFGPRCDQYLVVEHNGDIYPCDFFVDEEYRLGNIHETTFIKARKSTRFVEFSKAKTRLPAACKSCRYFSLCLGDCPKYRTGKGKKKLSRLCEGWRFLFDHILDRCTTLARTVGAARGV